MSHNIGEEIVGTYLKVIKGCEFVDYNINTTESQGEIDVIGVDNINKKVYICEVAIHLETGLQYTNLVTKRPDNTSRLISKFEKDAHYARQRFENFENIFMFWSPIVKAPKNETRYNQLTSVKDAQTYLKEKSNIDLILVVNEDFQKCLEELKDYSWQQSQELKTPVLRLMQIEEKLRRFVAKTAN